MAYPSKKKPLKDRVAPTGVNAQGEKFKRSEKNTMHTYPGGRQVRVWRKKPLPSEITSFLSYHAGATAPIPDRIGDSWRKNPTGRSPYSSMAVPNSGGRYDNTRRSGLRNGVEGTEDPQRLPKLQGRRRKGNRYYRTD